MAWEYWLPTPFASFPFTSPPVRHRVPPGSERAPNYVNGSIEILTYTHSHLPVYRALTALISNVMLRLILLIDWKSFGTFLRLLWEPNWRTKYSKCYIQVNYINCKMRGALTSLFITWSVGWWLSGFPCRHDMGCVITNTVAAAAIYVTFSPAYVNSVYTFFLLPEVGNVFKYNPLAT